MPVNAGWWYESRQISIPKETGYHDSELDALNDIKPLPLGGLEVNNSSAQHGAGH